MRRYRRFGELVLILAERTLRARYRGSILGVYWSLMSPLAMTFVYTAIFGRVFAPYYNGSLIQYGVVVFVGLNVINFFTFSTGQALPSVVGNSALLNKVRVPAAVFPASTVAAHAVQLAVGTFPVLVVVVLLQTHEPLRLLLLPIPLLGLVMLSTGVALVVSTAFVFFRDIPHIYELIAFLAWIASPIFYPIAIVPERIRQVLYFNPLFPTIQSLRDIVTAGAFINQWLLVASLLVGMAGLLAGYAVFTGLKRRFMDFV